MPTRANDRLFEEDRECDRHYGLEHDEYAEFVHELELADRIADQASLPPGHCAARRLARVRLGLGRSPYERPNAPAPPPSLAPGEAVTYRGPAGDGRTRHGSVEQVLDEDHGAVVVRFEGGVRSALPAEALERRAAGCARPDDGASCRGVRLRARLRTHDPARPDRRRVAGRGAAFGRAAAAD
jgi:hypothetical protein